MWGMMGGRSVRYGGYDLELVGSEGEQFSESTFSLLQACYYAPIPGGATLSVRATLVPSCVYATSTQARACRA